MTAPLPQNIDVARRDLAAIEALLKFEPFSAYWLRKVREKREELDRRFHDDPPEKCDAVQREARRQVIAAYDELLKMPEQHAEIHKRTLAAAAAQEAKT